MANQLDQVLLGKSFVRIVKARSCPSLDSFVGILNHGLISRLMYFQGGQAFNSTISIDAKELDYTVGKQWRIIGA